MKYAKGTVVSPEKSQAEIRQTLKRYGADGFALVEQGDRAVVAFSKDKRSVKFEVRMPDRNAEEFTHFGIGWNKRPRTESSAQNLWDQACRQRWRALALGIKAKLEFIESGITTFEAEFLSHIVTHSGATVGQMVLPQLERGASPRILLNDVA